MNYKKGDFVATEPAVYVMIIKEQLSDDCAEVVAMCDEKEAYFAYRGWFNRLATEEEKARLLLLLQKKGYTWDEGNLELIQEL